MNFAEKPMSTLFKKITHYPTLEAAFARVQENAGCRGSDGVSITRFAYHLERNLRDLSNSLHRQTYQPFPLMRFPIPKRSGGQRFLSVPTVRDRIAQTAAFLTTREIFEAEFETMSHGYRAGRGVGTAIQQIKKWRDQGYRHAVDADIDSYFDNVPHDLLLKKLGKLLPDEPQILSLFQKWIAVEVYDGQRIWRLQKGIPQGSVTSPALANLFLDTLDETLMGLGLKLVRYADDFLVLTKSEKEADDAYELTDMVLEDLQLDLNPLKTKIVSFDSGFKFLGAIFLYDTIYLPYHEKRKRNQAPKLPRPLTLRSYLEMRDKHE